MERLKWKNGWFSPGCAERMYNCAWERRVADFRHFSLHTANQWISASLAFCMSRHWNWMRIVYINGSTHKKCNPCKSMYLERTEEWNFLSLTEKFVSKQDWREWLLLHYRHSSHSIRFVSISIDFISPLWTKISIRLDVFLLISYQSMLSTFKHHRLDSLRGFTQFLEVHAHLDVYKVKWIIKKTVMGAFLCSFIFIFN